MILHKQYIIFVLFIFIFKCLECSTVDVYIPNDKYDIYNISDIISNYAIKYNDINIYLNEEYMLVKKLERNYHQIYIPGNVNVSLIGNPNNGTIIDFSENFFYYSILFTEHTGQQIRIENITFHNFNDPLSSLNNDLFYVSSYSNNYQIIFKNCIFDGSNSLIFDMEPRDNVIKRILEYQVLFDSCQFK